MVETEVKSGGSPRGDAPEDNGSAERRKRSTAGSAMVQVGRQAGYAFLQYPALETIIIIAVAGGHWSHTTVARNYLYKHEQYDSLRTKNRGAAFRMKPSTKHWSNASVFGSVASLERVSMLRELLGFRNSLKIQSAYNSLMYNPVPI